MSRATIPITLLPLGLELAAVPGTALQDLLFAQGVEFPCGGRGRCQGCRVRVIEGCLPLTPEDLKLLGPARVEAGWRLACRARIEGPLTLELAQWEAQILADDASFEFVPREGLGVAVDLGTTTLVAQLVDLRTGEVLAVRTALNAQARHGADIMSRIDFALAGDGETRLRQLVREQVGALIPALLAAVPAGRREPENVPLSHPAVGSLQPATGGAEGRVEGAQSQKAGLADVVVVGNTAMHHLFCGIPIQPLAHHPFEPVDDGLKCFRAAELGWTEAGDVPVRFLPCLGGFVGSDILAGILATGLHRSAGPRVLVDLGTNGEIVVGNRDRLLCASTAAGPAFEGARISMGMRAATGAISEVQVQEGELVCRVLGGGEARGICGSGLVDAVAAGLELGKIRASGRFVTGDDLPLAGAVKLSQQDIRELQLAKGAIAAGIRILLDRWGACREELEHVHLAGAFGNYINRASARRIGLLDFPLEQVEPAGNTALRGAKLALFELPVDDGRFAALRPRIEHVALRDDPGFHDAYIEAMGFPASGVA